jgi:glyoxylase-like metal-dependent hydrolase (beta-lactamase superfamily II)
MTKPLTKPPQDVFFTQLETETPTHPTNISANKIFAFAPNSDTLGGSAYLLVRAEGNVLIDCPALDQINLDFLHFHGSVQWLFLTHRGAMGKTAEIQKIFGCEILVQEQEAYLLPGLTSFTFGQEFTLDSTIQAIWTPGHSPGSSCLYYRQFGGVLFSGRHLVPNQQGQLMPIRTAKTFHWPRQLSSMQFLRERFTAENLEYIFPGANIGFLRGKHFIDQAGQQLNSLILQDFSFKWE